MYASCLACEVNGGKVELLGVFPHATQIIWITLTDVVNWGGAPKLKYKLVDV